MRRIGERPVTIYLTNAAGTPVGQPVKLKRQIKKVTKDGSSQYRSFLFGKDVDLRVTPHEEAYSCRIPADDVTPKVRREAGLAD